jgi:hypothetical protein
MIEGFVAWNNLNQRLRWIQGGFDVGYFDPVNSCAANGIFYLDAGINPNTGRERLGVTHICRYSANICRLAATKIIMDVRNDWYTLTNSPASNQYDFRSVATHEAGHASGFNGGAPCPSIDGHWADAASICQNNPSHHTMCSSTFIGTSWDRSLGTHEVTAFNARY